MCRCWKSIRWRTREIVSEALVVFPSGRTHDHEGEVIVYGHGPHEGIDLRDDAVARLT